MLNYTIRPVLWVHKKTTAGLCPLKICVTINRKQIYFKTPYRLREDQWKNNIIVKYANEKLANAGLRKQMAELEKEITSQQLQGGSVTSKLLRHGSVKAFVRFAREVRDNETEINRIIEFSGESTLITEMNVAYLRKYEKHERDRGQAQNTLNTTFKYLRRIIRQAKKEKIIVENPFDDFDVPKYVQTDRLYLIDSEKKKLIRLFDKKLAPSMYNTLCWFLLGCYSGLRHSDWLLFRGSMVDHQYLRLRAKKNKQFVVLPIGPTLRSIITRVEGLAPPMSNQKSNVMLKAIAALAGVDKMITTHTARHSFGYLCASNRIPKSVTAELMGITVRTVEVYYHLSGENIREQAAILKTI